MKIAMGNQPSVWIPPLDSLELAWYQQLGSNQVGDAIRLADCCKKQRNPFIPATAKRC